MATATFDQRGCVIGLDDKETNDLLNVITPISGGGGVVSILAFFKVVGIAAILGATGPWIAAAIAAHALWESAVIRISNRGNGVWLYAAPEIWLRGGAGIVIPHFRTDSKTFDGHQNDGEMISEHSDLITWHVDRGVGAADDCKFVLINECDWAKAYKLYIGTDTWWVQADGHQTAENGSWAHDLGKTQIVFHKPQFLGNWGPVGLTIANFDGLHAQDITTFRWVKDT